MTEHKFTDDEIIRALECCKNEDCDNCPFFKYPKSICRWDVWDCALDLINRQKAEIERLREDIKAQDSSISSLLSIVNSNYQNGRNEAIKEFADKVIGLIYEADDINTVSEWQILNLVKEMTVGKE